MTGTIVAFDEHRGLGAVEADDGRHYPFHCTRLVDGSRAVPVGSAVSFAVVAGHLGRWEATALSRLDQQPAAPVSPS